MTKPISPVRLEVNHSGLWHTVADFDAHNQVAEFSMRVGVELLAAMDDAATFRVVTRDIHCHQLLTYSSVHGWFPA